MSANEDINYSKLIGKLMTNYNLSFYHNPGGGEFIGTALYEGRCQVPFMNAKQDYEILIANLNRS